MRNYGESFEFLNVLNKEETYALNIATKYVLIPGENDG